MERKKLLGKNVAKDCRKLLVGEITPCRMSGRFRGVSVGRDKNGYYVTTHRARSSSKSSLKKVTKAEIKFIESTG